MVSLRRLGAIIRALVTDWEPTPLPALRSLARTLFERPVLATLVLIVALLASQMGFLTGRAVSADTFNPSVTVASRTVLKTGGSPRNWHGRAVVVTRPDGVKVLVYRSGESHLDNNAQMHIRFKEPGGSWTADDTTLDSNPVTGFPMNPPEGNINAGDASVYVTPSGRLVMHMWSVVGGDWPATLNGTWQSESNDGHAWTTPVQVDFGGGLNQDRTFATDDWFVYNGVIYTAARVYNADNPTDSYVVFLRNASDGDLDAWEYVSDITSAGSDTQEIGMEFVGDDTILSLIRSLNNDETLQGASTTLGASWSTIDVSGTVQVSGRHRMYTRMHLKGEPGWWRDRVMLVNGFQLMNPGSSQDRRNCVWVAQVVAGGPTMKYFGPFYLDTETEDAGYGDIYWDEVEEAYFVISYDGSLAAADLVEYKLTVSGF